MKPSELPKDARDSVRLNSEVDNALRKAGLSTQKLFDWAVDQRLKMDLKLKVLKKSKPPR